MQKDFAIKVENVSKSFIIPTEKKQSVKDHFMNPFSKTENKKFLALSGVDFEVKKGEFLGIIGKNGSGKSTLLKILAGIYTPDKGKVITNGKIIPFLELGVGFNPDLSGRENVYLNGTILGMSKKYLNQRFDEIVSFAEVEKFIDMPLKNYSSGMQVRLAFAISMMADGDIYLMDEVLAVGDTNFQNRCIEIFNNYRDAGKTVVLVTHDISTVERFCERAVLMRSGKLDMIGKARKVVNEYTYQNMSDEEKRQIELEKKRLEQENKKLSIEKLNEINHPAEITKVEILNRNNEVKNNFYTGEEITIKSYLKLNNKSIKVLNFGISMETEEGGYIFGYNTQMDSFKFDKESPYICITFPSMPLLQGKYFINVACFGDEGEGRFDFKPRYKSLRIYSKDEARNYKGFINIPHSWKI